jgi:hypothetical protein
MGSHKLLQPIDAEPLENSQARMREPTKIARSPASDRPKSRRHLLRIFFVHRCVADVESCLYELRRVGLVVTSGLVVMPDQFAERLQSRPLIPSIVLLRRAFGI